MSPNELEQYLYAHIPLSRAMEVSVATIDEHKVVLEAPLAPNINHRETLFGGSASAVAILAAWSLLHSRMQREGVTARLVIQRNSMEYLLPVAGRFSARAALQDEVEWQRFLRMFQRKGKARIMVSSILEYAGDIAGRLEGEFVAINLS